MVIVEANASGINQPRFDLSGNDMPIAIHGGSQGRLSQIGGFHQIEFAYGPSTDFESVVHPAR